MFTARLAFFARGVQRPQLSASPPAAALARAGLPVSLVLSALIAAACAADDDVTQTKATETNFTELVCTGNEECGPQGKCKLHEEDSAPDAGARRGKCEPANK